MSVEKRTVLPIENQLQTNESSSVNFIVTTYAGYDADGLGACIGTQFLIEQLGGSCNVLLLGTPQADALYSAQQAGINLPEESMSQSDSNTRYILTDTKDIPEINPPIDINTVWAILDHHPANQNKEKRYPELEIDSNEKIGAVCTRVTEELLFRNIQPSEQVATLLLGGILSNTGGLLIEGVTTERDRNAVLHLQQITGTDDIFYRDMLESISHFTEETIEEKIKADMKSEIIDGKRYLIGQLQGVGFQKVFKDNYSRIHEIIEQIKTDAEADFIFLSCVEQRVTSEDRGRNYFATTGPIERQLLMDVLEATEESNYLVRDGNLLRKEIIPLLRGYIEPM